MEGFFFFPKIVEEAMESLAKTAGCKETPLERNSGIVLYNDHNMLV